MSYDAELDNLMDSLQNVIDATAKHNAERDAYDGYSWDYHGYHYIEKMQNAQEEFRKSFGEMIRNEVKKQLNILEEQEQE